jgi:hypothetical protein
MTESSRAMFCSVRSGGTDEETEASRGKEVDWTASSTRRDPPDYSDLTLILLRSEQNSCRTGHFLWTSAGCSRRAGGLNRPSAVSVELGEKPGKGGVERTSGLVWPTGVGGPPLANRRKPSSPRPASGRGPGKAAGRTGVAFDELGSSFRVSSHNRHSGSLLPRLCGVEGMGMRGPARVAIAVDSNVNSSKTPLPRPLAPKRGEGTRTWEGLEGPIPFQFVGNYLQVVETLTGIVG